MKHVRKHIIVTRNSFSRHQKYKSPLSQNLPAIALEIVVAGTGFTRGERS